MAIDLLGYKGDAGLGLGSNPDINVTGGNLNVLNDTMRNLMLLDNERNIKLFQQKVKDRDNLENLILQNEVSTGDIDPRDQKYFDKQKSQVEKAYSEWGGNFNDTAGFRKYQSAVTGLQDTATHAQMRWAGLKKLQQERSQQVLPDKIKAYDTWIEKQEKQPFGSQIVPYQQLHDFSIDDILSGVTPIKSSIVDPNNPVAYDVSTVDYGDILKNKRNQYINDQNVADSIDQFTDKIMQYDQPQLKKTVDAANAQISKYNQQRNLQEGQPGYAAPIQTKTTDDGKLIITEPKTDLAAKWALANQQEYITKIPKLNKDVLKYKYDLGRLELEKEKNRINAAKVGVERTKANAYARHMDAATKKILDQSQVEGTDITKQYNDFIDNIKPSGILLSKGGKKTGELDAIYMDEMPAGYQYINGPVVDPKGKVVAAKLVPFNEGSRKDKNGNPIGRPYYIPRYVDPATGDKIDVNKLPEEIQAGYEATRKIRNISKPDFVRALLKKGALELVLQGKNGSANYTSLSQSAKAMNNAAAKKGQENVMNPPESAPNEPETPIETSSTDNNPENN